MYTPVITIIRQDTKELENRYGNFSNRVKIEADDGKTYYGTLIPADDPVITLRLDNGEKMKFE